MPRIRYLKPEFFTDEDLCSLPYETRLAFAGLWCHADKSGRLEDRPRFLKISIFPYDNVDMEKQLRALTEPKPFIHRYEADGKRYIQIVHWEKHQRPHHTEKESEIPPVPPLNTKEKGMGKEKQIEASAELKNGDATVKEPLTGEGTDFNAVSLSGNDHPKEKGTFPEITPSTPLDKNPGGNGEGERPSAASGKPPAASLPPDFLNFWNLYPSRNGRKDGRSDAVKEWLKLKPDRKLQEKIIKALQAQIKFRQRALRTAGPKDLVPEFPDACRWIKHRRWEDEIKEESELWKERAKEAW